MSWTSGGGLATRSLWVPAQSMTLDSGTAVTVGTAPDAVGAVALADAATQGALFTFMLPVEWAGAGSTLNAIPYWTPGSTDGVAHTVRWQYDTKRGQNGGDFTAAGTTLAWTGASAARTVGVAVYDTATAVAAGSTAAATELVRFSIRRLGADGADTYVGVVNLLGVRIDYATTS